MPNVDGTIAHAQLSFGNGMTMLGSVQKDETESGRLVKQPDKIGGGQTQSQYLVVNDVDAIYASAKAAGSKIVINIKDEDYGGRGFSCLDLEGNLGNSGPMTPGKFVRAAFLQRAPDLVAACARIYRAAAFIYFEIAYATDYFHSHAQQNLGLRFPRPQVRRSEYSAR